MKKTANNDVNIVGRINSSCRFSHNMFGVDFYLVDIAVMRLSGKEDILPLMITGKLSNLIDKKHGSTVEVLGQLRSYNSKEGRLSLSVFVKNIIILEDSIADTNINQIILKGYISKPVIYRKTPLGRDIADILIAVNRSYGKSDYLPCIAWGKNARRASEVKVGTKMHLLGRVQSREYIKCINGTVDKRIAYEVSATKVLLE